MHANLIPKNVNILARREKPRRCPPPAIFWYFLIARLVLVMMCLPLFHVAPVQGIEFTDSSLSGTDIQPPQPGIVLLQMTAANTEADPVTITGITFTYTGDAPGDVENLKLFAGSTSGSPLDTASLTGSAAHFSFTLDISTEEPTTEIFITADVTAGAADGHRIDGEITSVADVVTTGAGPAGTFPLHSLSPAYTVKVPPPPPPPPPPPVPKATHITIDNEPSSVVAGERFSFVVSCRKEDGTVDTEWTGSTLSISGDPGAAPGIAPSGKAPEYNGSGAWTAGDQGQRTCSFVLYKAESGRKVRVSDNELADPDLGSITVSAGPGKIISIAPVGTQTAGVPFNVTLRPGDLYGNAVPGHAGSVITLSAAYGVVASSGGFAPVFPSPYAWTGQETSGQQTLTIITYCQAAAAKLKASDTVLGEALSNEFSISAAPLSKYEIRGATQVHLRTKASFTALAKDAWGNFLSSYAAGASLSCTDNLAEHPDNIAFSAGQAAFDAVFNSWGTHTIMLQESGGSSGSGTFDVEVDEPPLPERFSMEAPPKVTGGKEFTATIKALDAGGSVIPEYNRTVQLAVAPPASIAPQQVTLAAGVWSGALKISGETLEAAVTLSDGEVTTSSALRTRVDIADFEKAITYPTVFTPRQGAVRIRYYLKEDRQVRVSIFNVLTDLVREMVFPAGNSGGRAGINVIEWDGRAGEENTIGRSGGYHILIDKGYEKEWTGVVIKNY